MTALC